MNRFFDLEFVLKNIEFVFLDYDDTLCFHRYMESSKECNEYWMSEMLSGRVDWYIDKEKCLSSKEMFLFTEACNDVGIKCYCLSWADTNICYNAKKYFIDVKYPDIDSLFLVGTREGKLDFVKRFCKINGVESSKILLVDDHPSTRDEFHKNGFYAVNPYVIIEEMKKFVS